MIYFLLWYLSGLASFVYWYTFDADLTVEEIPLLLLMGLFGVITFVMGVIIYFQQPVNYIIFHNRNRDNTRSTLVERRHGGRCL